MGRKQRQCSGGDREPGAELSVEMLRQKSCLLDHAGGSLRLTGRDAGSDILRVFMEQHKFWKINSSPEVKISQSGLS